jgi:hypothetical protein
MDEPALYNHGPHQASLLPIVDRDGAPARTVIVKATYDLRIGRTPKLAEIPREVRMGDEPWGAPEVADLRLPGDFCIAKPGTDFVVSGHAVAPRSVPVPAIDVGIRVADRIKLMRVHGPRTWRNGILGVAPSAAEPAERTPLAWSRAYGGLDLSDPQRPLEEARNPVGSGVAHRPERLVGTPAPQIESPDAPITAAGGRYVPVGCAPLGRHFEPRRKLAGTYDAAWLRSGYPARPSDYRSEHEQCAAPDLVFAQPLRGGESVRLVGVHAEGALEFVLPKWLVRIDARIDAKVQERQPHLDTVVVDTDAMVLEMVWRALFRCPPRMRDRFTSVRVQCKEFIA